VSERPFTKEVLDGVALAIMNDYLATMPYLTVVEGFHARFGRDATDYEADYIYDAIIKGDV